MGDTTTVSKLPACDFCAHEGRGFIAATYDFRTSMGPWANACESHWREHRATTRLGTGNGQRLVVDDLPVADTAAVTASMDAELRAATGGAVVDSKTPRRRPTAGEVEIAMIMAESEGSCEALDGCTVEPDGECAHGFPSVLRAAGVI
jgi:hypothetical protein